MNKKITKIALLIFVILIWGKVIMDFFKYKEQKETMDTVPLTQKVSPLVSEPFNYELKLEYRDPFLGKYPKSDQKKPSTQRRSYSAPKPKKPEEKPKPKPPVKWPKIEYVGNIENKKTAKESVTLRVNGEESFMLPDQAIQGVKLEALYPDSIKLMYKEEQKTILR